MKCGQAMEISELREHVETCRTLSRESSSSRFEDTLMPMAQGPLYVSSSDEEDKMFPAVQVIHQTESTEDIMMQHAIENSTTVTTTYPMEQPQTLPDVVKGLAAKVASECFLLTVRRGHIMEDTLRGVRRSTYEPSKKLKIDFLGESGQDGGGLLREFWRLFASAVRDGILMGGEGNMIIRHDSVALKENKFHHIGTLMAVALSQGGSGFPFFAPCIFEYLKGTSIQDIKVTIEAVADWETRDLLMKIRDATTVELLQELCLQNVTVLVDAGYTKPVCKIELAHREEIIQMVAVQNTIMVCISELQQLREGLRALGVADLIEKHPLLLQPFFVHHTSLLLTADAIKQLFSYIAFSTAGSTEREREQSVYMFFMDLLHECEDDQESTLQLGDVLSFFTGADKLPPLGLPHNASIYFNSENEYPTASTCALHIVLPTKH